MINKQLKEIKDKLDIAIKLMQDNEYLDNLDKGLEHQNLVIEKLKQENDFLKQLLSDDKKYSYGIRIGGDKE